MRWTLYQKVIAAFCAVLLVAGVVVAAQSQHGKTARHKDINETLLSNLRTQATAVSTVTVGYGAVRQELKLTGTIKSPNSANVSAAIPGQIQSVAVTEGSRVYAGQVLAELNPAQANVQVGQVRQQVAAAQSAYTKALSGRELTYKQANGDVSQARLALAEAQTGLAKANAGASAATVEGAQATARQAHAAAKEAADALTRSRFLFEHDVVPRSTLEDVQTKAAQAADAADAADAAVRQAQEGATVQDRQLAADKVSQAREGLRQAEEARGTREAIADADVQSALTQVRSAQDQLRLAQIQQGGTRVISPIGGIVSAVRIHAGETAAPGEPLFSITSLGGVYFETAVSETEKLQLAPGQQASITLQAIPDRTFTGRVSDIVPVENPGAAGFLARIAITPPADVVIPPGAYARATVLTGLAQHVLVVPVQAVQTDTQNQQSVYVITNGKKAELRPITTGFSNGVQEEVRSGLQAGDQVVIAGAEFLQPGAAVVVQQGASR